MKKIFFVSLMLLIFSSIGYSAVTTIDGVITLDFYEDTQFGNNRWILDFTVNDVGGDGSGAIAFSLRVWNYHLSYNNEYNSPSEYYIIGEYHPMPGYDISIPVIGTDMGQLLTPIGTKYLFYAIPNENYYPSDIDYVPTLGVFDIDINGERVHLTGPVGFSVAPVPEPSVMFLLVFGIFILKFIQKAK